VSAPFRRVRPGYGGIWTGSKSVTNQLHGTAYEIVRNAVLDANSLDQQLSLPRQPDNQHDFGFEVPFQSGFQRIYNGITEPSSCLLLKRRDNPGL